jgi:phage terminase small subunit
MLTEKQENFCIAYCGEAKGNASEAYRIAYDCENMKPESVHRKAKEVMDNVKISSRIKELREPAVKALNITLEDLLKELEEARTMAMTTETPQSSAAINATMGKAKLLGLDKQVVDHNIKIVDDGSHEW